MRYHKLEKPGIEAVVLLSGTIRIIYNLIHLLICLFIPSIFIFSAVIAQVSENLVYNIKDFGAVGDGITLNTVALQKTINKCGETGGTVLIPPGKYLTGSLELQNDVKIHLEHGALLLGSTKIEDYQSHQPELKSYNDYFLRYSLFYAEGKENIAISGEGIIDGQGEAFKVTTKKKPARYLNRPFVIRFIQCKNIRIENITLRNSAMWMQQYLACEDLLIRGIRVFNHANQNNDMMDIDGCKNVIISDCFGDTDDDALTLKSTSPFITQNVTITNCVISSHCNAIKMGTESTGGFRNISISNIVVKPSKNDSVIFGQPQGISGITLGMVDGGILENINISGIVIDGPLVPIYLRLGNRGRKHFPEAPEPGVGIFRNVQISNITASNIKSIGCSITGIPGFYLENITLSDIQIEFEGGGTFEDVNKVIPELEDHYPESTKWGMLPAYGFYIRHVKNIVLDNVNIAYKNRDVRSPLICEDLKGISIYGLRAECDSDAEAFIKMKNVRDVSIYNSSSLNETRTFLNLSGTESKNILLSGNNMNNFKNYVYTDLDNKIIEIQ